MKFKTIHNHRFDLLAFTCLICLGFLVYSNNYQVPWYFDDFRNITENQAIFSLSDPLGTLFLSRGPALLSFALNYALHGESLPGYHLVNNVIHILVSIVVYLLLKRVTSGARYWALTGALVFLTHPLQTQAVTYIVQRMTSLSALFAFTCGYCFVRGREALADGAQTFSLRHATWYTAMLVFCALAVATKQNTAFLPIGLFVFGRYFVDMNHGWNRKRSIVYLAPFLIPPLFVAYSMIIVPLMHSVPLSEITSTEGSNISPLYYFVTQWQIVWIYLRLLFVPLGQTLDYGYPIVNEIFSLKTVLSGSGIVCLVYAAYRWKASLPQLSFAITWFFVSLAVESTFIPLDVLFEHRLYIPMFGFSVMFIWICRSIPWCTVRVGIPVIMMTIYCLLTLQRNTLWGDPIAFNEDNLRKAPHNERPNIELSKLYIERKRYPKAREKLMKALSINPRSEKAYDNLGTLYDLTGNPGKAVENYRTAIAINPGYLKPYVNLAVVYSSRGEYAIAEELLSKAVVVFPNDASLRYNLGVAQYHLNKRSKARDSFAKTLTLAPYDADALYNLALVQAELGAVIEARAFVPRMQAIDPARAVQLVKEIGQARQGIR